MFKRFFGPTVVAAALGALALAGTAAAQTGNPFGCTAGTATATLGGQNLLPGTTIANPRVTPCANDQQLLNATPFNALGLVSGTLGPISARTKLTTSTVGGSTVYTGATATSDVDAATISVGATPVAPGLTIGITTPSQAKVDYACVNNQLQTNYSSTLNAITIDGQTVPLTGLPQNLSNIPGVGSELSGIADIEVNQHTSTASSDTETLLHVQLLGALDSGVTLDVGNATASTTQSSPCSGTSGSGGNGGGGGTGGGGTGGGGGGNGGGGGGNGGGGNGGGSGSGNCPSGSTAIAGNLCEIAAGSEGNRSAITFNGGNISGGSVISLTLARRRYRSLCLDGPGPNYAVIGTNRANRITVARTRQRVLGLGGNDRITVKSGNNTCVDGGTGNDTVKAGNAPVRVYGGEGNDKITVGNGKDVVYGDGGQDVIKAGNGNDSLNGGAGNDRITAGNGRDRLYGNAGADRLTAGTGRDYLFGAAGNDRLSARGRHAYLNGGGGRNVAYVLRANVKFARHHGCRKVHVL